MTNQMTDTQIEALEFFEDNYQAVQAYGMAHLADREERALYRQGRDLLDQACQVRKTRTLYTEDELVQIIHLYIRFDGNTPKVRDQFMIDNPKTAHTAESIRACAGQLKAMDLKYPNDHRWVVKSLVQEVATNEAPDRFKGIA